MDRLLSFASVHHAVRAEKLLRRAGIAVDMIPTPRQIDISCGQCLLLPAGDKDTALDILDRAHVRWSKLFAWNSAERAANKLAENGG